MFRVRNEYLVVVALGLLCVFMGSVIVSLIAVNFVVALICALFCMKKDYIFILLLALNFALYFNAIDTLLNNQSFGLITCQHWQMQHTGLVL